MLWDKKERKMLIELLCIFNTAYILANILAYICNKYNRFYLKRTYLKILKNRGFKLKTKKKQIFEFPDEEPQEEFNESCIKRIESDYTNNKSPYDASLGTLGKIRGN